MLNKIIKHYRAKRDLYAGQINKCIKDIHGNKMTNHESQCNIKRFEEQLNKTESSQVRAGIAEVISQDMKLCALTDTNRDLNLFLLEDYRKDYAKNQKYLNFFLNLKYMFN